MPLATCSVRARCCVAFDGLLSGAAAPPPEGARFDF